MTSTDSSAPPSDIWESSNLVQNNANGKSGWLESTFGGKSLHVSVRCYPCLSELTLAPPNERTVDVACRADTYPNYLQNQIG